LNHESNPWQNVLKMSTMSPDISREMETQLNDGWYNILIVQFFSSTNSLCFSSAGHHYYISGKGITQALLEMQLQLCPEWTHQ